MRVLFLFPFVLSLLVASVGFSANRIRDQSVQIDSPLSEADVVSIKALKRWPRISILLTKTATPEAFASLAQIPELHDLIIDSNNESIRDLSPVAALSGLRGISVHNYQLAKDKPISLAPLANCLELSTVRFSDTPVTDVNALAACGKLREVNFHNSEVDSLDFLASTPDVRVLNLSGSRHTFPNYAPVAKLTKLRELDIYLNRPATDQNLSALKVLTSLRVMSMDGCKQVSSLEFLANCIELEELSADGITKLDDIGPLARMPYLTAVDISETSLSDLEPLADKIYLLELDIAGTKVTDLSALRSSAHLKSLAISDTAIADLTPLAGMRRMEVLNANETSVADLTPLKKMSELRSLHLSSTSVTDLAPLHDLGKLSRITLSRTTPEAQIEALKAALLKLSVELH